MRRLHSWTDDINQAFKAYFGRGPRCTLHDVIEGHCYPYRCHRCGECFVCRHTLWANRTRWTCPDGGTVPSTFNPGQPTL